MTQARAHTVAEGQHGLYHCVTRCARRAWLCGVDPITRVDHEQRKLMVEARIRELGSIFAVGIYAYAVMRKFCVSPFFAPLQNESVSVAEKRL